MKQTKYRKVIILVWFILAVFDTILLVSNPSILSALITGFMLGGAFILLLNHLYISLLEVLIKRYKFIFKEYESFIESAIKSELSNETKSKQRKKK